jgi:hypothetical protein
MSINVNLKTPHKKPLADVLRSIALIIEGSTNETVTVDLRVTLNAKEKAST